jgi:hypothetical protein
VTDPLPPPILPVQRRALDPSGLNVIGEEHDESEGRRKTEKRLAERKGLDYFNENEFLADDGDGDWKTKQTADPVELRVGHRADSLGKTVQHWAANILQPLLEGSASPSHQASDSPTVSSPEAGRVSPESGATKTLTPKDPEWLELRQKFWLEMQHGNGDLKSQLEAYANNETIKTNSELQKGFTELSQLSVTIDKFVAVFSAKVLPTDAEMQTLLIYAIDVGRRMKEVAREYFGVSPVKDVSVDRSVFMLLAAMSRHETKAVWKIGDSHVSDMEKILKGDEPKFALQHASEFNETYGELFRRMAL